MCSSDLTYFTQNFRAMKEVELINILEKISSDEGYALSFEEEIHLKEASLIFRCWMKNQENMFLTIWKKYCSARA